MSWQGLTYEEQEEIVLSAHSVRDAINKTVWKLKEKNEQKNCTGHRDEHGSRYDPFVRNSGH